MAIRFTTLFKQLLCAVLLVFGLAWQLAYAGHYLQVGVFSNEKASKNLVKYLRSQGFDVSQRSIEFLDTKSYVVLVGPYERSSAASNDQKRLREKGISSSIKRYPDLPKPKPKPSTLKGSVSGFIAAEARYFPDEPLYSTEQLTYQTSLVLQPEFYLSWNDRKSSLAFVPFVRVGDEDEQRNHADIRELMWINAIGDWELRLGIGKVFWGVTEAAHVVDVINQTDLVENIDGEDKLGQPMAQLSWFTELGTWDLFVLPLFRERTFPGFKGRLRGPLVVDTDQDAIYESPDRDKHTDYAIRWSHYVGPLDISVSHFTGTNRNPEFVLGQNAVGDAVLIPKYNLMNQTGVTMQAILGDWLLKLETTGTLEQNLYYKRAVAGFEYTYVGLFGSAIDLGFIAEYLYDSRRATSPSGQDDDLLTGLRWVFNDMQSTEILMGVLSDLNGKATSTSIEASRRIGQSWRLALEYRGWNVSESTDPGYFLRNDSYFQLDLGYYF